jgi:MFS family permease
VRRRSPLTEPSRTSGGGLRHAVEALHYRPFATFWTGALVSNTGVWMQNVTVPYVVFQTTGSAALVGVTAFCQFIPGLFVGPIGGWLADRHPRRTVLLVTQVFQALLALLLLLVYSAGATDTAVLIALVFATGVVQGLNLPAWQAFVPELVPRHAWMNAMTLNSAQFNAARAIGPAIAGVVLARFGPSWAFFLNALSYLAVIAAVYAVPRHLGAHAADRVTRGLLPQVRESLAFARSTRGVLVALVLLALGAGLGQPVFQLMPVFAAEVYDVQAWRYGLMAASLGAGGVIGAVLLGVFGANRRRSTIVNVSLTSYAMALIVFGASVVYLLGVIVLVIAGAFYISVAASLNTSVQMQVPEDLRGGVLALYVMTFNLAYPVGSLLQGIAADLVGPRWTVVGCGTIILLSTFEARRRHAFGALDADIVADQSAQWSGAGSTSENDGSS